MPAGPLFTISAINIARAAVREAERKIPVDAPVDIRVGSDDPRGLRQLYVEVTAHDGSPQRVDIDDDAVAACLEGDGTGYEAAHRMADELVELLAATIRALATHLLHGDPVTEEQIQAWADEAEAGYDLSELPEPRRGRPPTAV